MGKKDGKKSIIFPLLHLIGCISLVIYTASTYDNFGDPDDLDSVKLNSRCSSYQSQINSYTNNGPKFTDNKLIIGVFCFLAAMTFISICLTKASHAKAGLFTLFRVALEVGILIWLYVYMNDQINYDD